MDQFPFSVQGIRLWVPVIACVLGGCSNAAASAETADLATVQQAACASNEVRVVEEVEVLAPASTVWEAIGNFNGWSTIFPAVESSRMYGQGNGAVRFLKLSGQPDLVVERQDLNESNSRTLAYSILSSSLPVTNYRATIRVKAISGAKSRVEWSSQFQPNGVTRSEAEQFIRNFYVSNLTAVAEAFVPKVTVQKVIAAPAPMVWSIVGDFNALPEFLSVLQASYLVNSGANQFRIVTFFDGVTTSIERLDYLDDANRKMTYSAIGTPFGLANYVGQFEVVPQGSSSLVTWSVAYMPLGDPAEAQALMQGAIGSGLDSLASLFASD